MKSSIDNTSIVCAIRNRNEILEDSLRNWIRFDVPEIVIVDWRDDSCEKASKIVDKIGDPRVRLIETKYEYRFTISHALNLAILMAKYPYLLKIDVDCTLSDGFFTNNTLVNDEYLSGRNHPGLCGLVYISKERIEGIGAYNENLIYYGHDDRDLYHRLERNGLSFRSIEPNSAFHKEHSPVMSIVGQVCPSRDGISAGIAFRLKCLFGNINAALIEALPWTEGSIRAKWDILETEKNRYQAIRNQCNKRNI